MKISWRIGSLLNDFINWGIINVRKRFLLILFLPFLSLGQDYVDLFKISYGQTFKNKFQDTDSSTEIKSFNAGITLPIPISEKQALITGADFGYSNLQLFPDAEFKNLYSASLTLGLASSWSEKWSTTLVLLPKIASDYRHISSDDFFLGGIAILKLKKNENLLYRFGAYASQEAFGVFATPILGLYYLSPNKRFEMDLSLPIKGDINYKLGATTLGIDYFGISRSFNLHYDDMPPMYADLNSTEFSTYLQFNVLKESVLLRTKFGYSSNNYEVYAKDDKIDLGISAIKIGDDRTQLNPPLNGSIFLKLEMIYRYDIRKSHSTSANSKNK